MHKLKAKLLAPFQVEAVLKFYEYVQILLSRYYCSSFWLPNNAHSTYVQVKASSVKFSSHLDLTSELTFQQDLVFTLTSGLRGYFGNEFSLLDQIFDLTPNEKLWATLEEIKPQPSKVQSNPILHSFRLVLTAVQVIFDVVVVKPLNVLNSGSFLHCLCTKSFCQSETTIKINLIVS